MLVAFASLRECVKPSRLTKVCGSQQRLLPIFWAFNQEHNVHTHVQHKDTPYAASVNPHPRRVAQEEPRTNKNILRLSEFIQPTFQALLVDACGTLVHPSEPLTEVYMRYGRPYGISLSPEEMLWRYRRAYSTPWAESSIRYVDDGRPFWRFIVKESTGIDNEQMFEEIYDYYARAEAWVVAPGAEDALRQIRQSGIKTAVVSNFDSRLHRILDELGLTSLFDVIVVSADVSAEKPNPVIFLKACEELNVSPEHVIHVGDDRRNDLKGARDAGCFAWLWGDDVFSFRDVHKRLETGNLFDSLSDI